MDEFLLATATSLFTLLNNDYQISEVINNPSKRCNDMSLQPSYLVPERKPMFRPNPNVEIRNSKQIRISNDKMTQTKTLQIRYFCHWGISILVIVSYFVLRISNF